MPSLTVAKFGGTSMATAYAMDLSARRVASNQNIRVVVVSAPGRISERNNPDGAIPADGRVKVTDTLLDAAATLRRQEPIDERIRGVESRYRLIEDGLGIGAGDRASTVLRERVRQNAAAYNNSDAGIAALGEALQAPLFAAYLRMLGIRARHMDPRDANIIVAQDRNGAYCVNPADYGGIRQALQPSLDEGYVLVVPGFFGYDPSGAIQTFPRGGSDYTGSVLAAALGAGLYQNFTDVDGIRVVEPEISATAPFIRGGMTHRELTELTLGGRFGVFQYEAAVPLALNGVVTQVLDTFNPSSQGTYVLPQLGNGSAPIRGIAYRGECVVFEIIQFGGANSLGFFGDVGTLFSDLRVSVEHAPSSTNDISVIVKKSSIEAAGLTTGDIVRRIREQLRPFDLRIQEDIGLVAVVGEGIGNTVGLGEKIFGAVARAQANIVSFLHEGITMTLLLRNGDAKTAAHAIYDEFFGDGRH